MVLCVTQCRVFIDFNREGGYLNIFLHTYTSKIYKIYNYNL